MRRMLTGVAVAAATLLLGACGSAGPASTPAISTPANPTTTPRTSATVPTTTASTSAGAARPSRPVAVRRVSPAPTPCSSNSQPKYVYVSIARQHLWMCAWHQVAYSTGITSGMVGEYTETPTGTFTIQGRDRDTVLTLADGQQYNVQYWIPFQGPLFGFHDSPWQTFPYGSPQYRTDGSHGCVHMPLTAIAYLYNWAPVGTPVRIAA